MTRSVILRFCMPSIPFHFENVYIDRLPKIRKHLHSPFPYKHKLLKLKICKEMTYFVTFVLPRSNNSESKAKKLSERLDPISTECTMYTYDTGLDDLF